MQRILSRPMASPPPRVPVPRNGVDYRGKVVLAPMVRSGELPTRLLSLKYGADLVWGPETVDKSLIGTTRIINPFTQTVDFIRRSNKGSKTPSPLIRPSVIFRIHPSEKPYLVYQLGTSSPSLAVQAASLVAQDVAGIDVNAGCPKPFSTTGGMGAALLRTPDLLCSILSALVSDVGTPHQIGISVKIRLLETEEKTGALVTALCKTGITGLTVHCRTTPMRPRERAIRHHLALIASICRAHGVACVMNGDVTSRAEAQKLIQEYHVDGAMIATASESNPSCFLHSSSSLGSDQPTPLLPWQTVVKDYLPLCLSTDNKYGNTKFMLNHFIHGKDPAHRKVVQSRSYSEVVEILGLEELKTLAIEVDERLGLGSDQSAVGKMYQWNETMQKEDNREQGKEETDDKAKFGLSNLETLTTALNKLERDLPKSTPSSHEDQDQIQQQQQLQPLSV